MLVLFLERVGIREYQLLVNSVGCPKCRAAYLEVLRQALQDVKATMCVDCQRRADTNPLRVLDCKVEADQPIIEKLPKIIDHLDPECRQHFERVTSELQARGLAYQITPRLVRGLDYYTRTTFEITSGALGAQNARGRRRALRRAFRDAGRPAHSRHRLLHRPGPPDSGRAGRGGASTRESAGGLCRLDGRGGACRRHHAWCASCARRV